MPNPRVCVRGLIFRMGYGVWLRWIISRRCDLFYNWCAQLVVSCTLVVRRAHHLDRELILYLRVWVTFVRLTHRSLLSKTRAKGLWP